MTDSAQPVAGWYPDPENATAERWWDGTSWTDHRRPSTVAAAPPAAPPVAPAAEPGADPASDPNGFAAPGASLAGSAPAAVPYASPYAAPGYPASGYPAPGYGAPGYAPAAPVNNLAVVGLALALGGLLVSFGGLTCLAGGIISTVALARASKMRQQGLAGHRWGMALAGTICGYALFVLVLGITIAGISLLVNTSQYGGYGTLS
jgi:hypothetical protein